MRKLLVVLAILFAGKTGFAQDRVSYWDNGSNQTLVNDFYLVGDCPGHFFMEAQNYSAPQSPGVTVDSVKIWVRGHNSTGPDFYQQNVSYPNATIGDVYMDVYGLDFSLWDSVIAHWQMFYSDGTSETYEYEWDHGYWW